MFVITGASGNTGSVAARALLDAGKAVRVLVRDPSRVKGLAERGAEVVAGDLWDEAALAKAAAGAEGVYLLSPPNLRPSDFVAERRVQLEGAVRALRAAGVGHVVLLSSIGAQHATGHGPVQTVHAGEQALRASGVPATFVRPAYFVENWGPVVPVARKDGVLPSFIPAATKIPMVAVRDIGGVVARALLEGPPHGVRVLELAGPAEASPADVAASLGRALGRPVTVAEAPLEAVVPTFTSFGLSENIASLYREMYQAIRTGGLEWQGRGTELVRGPTSLDQALAGLVG
jgi:uncharacterized protein YbjT (DUF2867 family)